MEACGRGAPLRISEMANLTEKINLHAICKAQIEVATVVTYLRLLSLSGSMHPSAVVLHCFGQCRSITREKNHRQL